MMQDIKLTTNLFDVLNEYPDLESIVIDLAPPFKNLKNPVLRKTVAKLATIEKVARIGNLEPIDLVNMLRKEVGQPEIKSSAEVNTSWQTDDPEWIRKKPVHIIDGTEMLSRGVHPLQKVNQLLRQGKEGDLILLRTNFRPIPLIDEMEKQSYTVYSKSGGQQPEQHYTYVMNSPKNKKVLS